jgi:preprotein translocase subunit SecE
VLFRSSTRAQRKNDIHLPDQGDHMATEVKAMELKKSQPATNSKEVTAKGKSVFDFIGDIKDEFSKITWTSPDELRTYTKIVVGATFLLGMGIYGVDFCIQLALNTLSYIFHFIFG